VRQAATIACPITWPAEHPLPARLRAVAAKQFSLDRFEIEDRNQVEDAFGHGSAFG
jgi:hypothetical protein